MSIINAFSVDVEEHFQVLNFQRGIAREQWVDHESRVGGNTRAVMDLMDEAGVRGTFFVLGWVADRNPELVREIAARGHELASHGWSHTPLTKLDQRAFRDEAERTKKLLEDQSGSEVIGFRAPSFSILEGTFWGLDVLLELGYRYDSSIFPVRHPDYGVPDAPREIHARETPGGARIVELPMTVASLLGRRVPVSGGGYFRLLPYGVTRWGLRQANRRGRPAVFYLHPWEVDPGQPDLRRHTSRLGAFRHYTGLRRTAGRLRRLMRTFSFAPCGDVLRRAGWL